MYGICEKSRESDGENVIIIHEMSMVDLRLMHALLKAVIVGTRLILVDQESALLL